MNKSFLFKCVIGWVTEIFKALSLAYDYDFISYDDYNFLLNKCNDFNDNLESIFYD